MVSWDVSRDNAEITGADKGWTASPRWRLCVKSRIARKRCNVRLDFNNGPGTGIATRQLCATFVRFVSARGYLWKLRFLKEQRPRITA